MLGDRALDSEDVKASRKEKGRDTLGCPVFLRPLPPQLLASFRGLESLEPLPSMDPPTGSQWRVQTIDPNTLREEPKHTGLQQVELFHCCGKVTARGDFCPYCGHVPRAPAPTYAPKAAPPAPALNPCQPTIVGPSFWIWLATLAQMCGVVKKRSAGSGIWGQQSMK